MAMNIKMKHVQLISSCWCFDGKGRANGHPYLEKFWELVGPSIEECWQMMVTTTKDPWIQLWSQRYYRGDYHDYIIMGLVICLRSQS